MTGQKGVLLEYQKRWVADKSTIKLIEKSRRVGISWAEAADDVLYAASNAGADVWYIGYNQDMAKEFINDCGFWTRHFNEIASEMEEIVIKDEDKDIIAFRITFASGFRITALSSRPTNLRGKKGRVVIDEAAFHDDLPGLLKAAIALTMWGGDVRIISTHNGEGNPFNEIIDDIRAGKKSYSLHRVDLDEALEDELYKRICEVTDKKWSPEAEQEWRQQLIDDYGDDADEELFCVPSKGSGVYLTRALIMSCMDRDIPVIRWACPDGFDLKPDLERESITTAWCEDYLSKILDELDPKQNHFFGEDFGRSGDLTVVIPLAEQKNLVYRAPFVLELRNCPFRQQEQVLFYIVDRLPRFRMGALDARGNGQALAEYAMQRYGKSRIQQVMLSTAWYRENMPAYKAAFEDRTIILPNDADILNDNRAFKMVKGVAQIPEGKRTKGKDKGQRHGDAGVAGALAIFAVNSELSGPPEYKTVSKRQASFKKGAW